MRLVIQTVACAAVSVFEFGCWCGVAILPWLWWVNGQAVSADQAWVRSLLLVAAAVAAFTLTVWRLICSRFGKGES